MKWAFLVGGSIMVFVGTLTGLYGQAITGGLLIVAAALYEVAGEIFRLRNGIRDDEEPLA